MLGEVLAALAALTFSTAAVLYRFAMRESSSGGIMAGIVACGLRAVPTLAVLLVAHSALGTSEPKPAEFYAACLLSALSSFMIGDSAFLYGLSRAPLGVVYPTAYSFSLFAALFSHLIVGERVAPELVASAVVIIAGIYQVYRGNDTEVSLVGVLSGLIAAVFWGLSVAFTALALRWGNPVDVNLFRVAFLSVLTMPVVITKRDSVRAVRLYHLILGGILGIGIGPLLFFASMVLEGAARPSIIVSCTPLITVILGKAFLGEEVTGRVFTGALLVTAGLVLLILL